MLDPVFSATSSEALCFPVLCDVSGVLEASETVSLLRVSWEDSFLLSRAEARFALEESRLLVLEERMTGIEGNF